MKTLTFGRRARRRARFKRGLVLTTLLTVAAPVAGIPATSGPLELIDALRRRGGRPTPGVESSENLLAVVRFRRKVFEARPGPAPPSTSTLETAEPKTTEPVASGSVTDIVYSAAAEFGLAGDYLVAVASCESGLDPQAYNAAGYHGLFQFDQQTWGAYGYGSIYDPVAQSRTAARLLAAGQSSRWPNCA